MHIWSLDLRSLQLPRLDSPVTSRRTHLKALPWHFTDQAWDLAWDMYFCRRICSYAHSYVREVKRLQGFANLGSRMCHQVGILVDLNGTAELQNNFDISALWMYCFDAIRPQLCVGHASSQHAPLSSPILQNGQGWQQRPQHSATRLHPLVFNSNIPSMPHGCLVFPIAHHQYYYLRHLRPCFVFPTRESSRQRMWCVRTIDTCRTLPDSTITSVILSSISAPNVLCPSSSRISNLEIAATKSSSRSEYGRLRTYPVGSFKNEARVFSPLLQAGRHSIHRQ